jgi:hypothetical protein
MKKLLLLFVLAIPAHGQTATMVAANAQFVNSGLLAYYDMVDASTTTLPDSSGNSNAGTWSGGGTPTTNTLGTVFVGGAGFWSIPSMNGVQTIEVWYTPTFSGFASNSSTTAEALVYPITGSGLQLPAYQAGSPSIGGSTEAVDRTVGPSSVAVVFGSPTTLYINGLAAGGYITDGNTSALGTTAGYIGGAFGTYPFYGTIKMVRLYTTALTAAQIAQDNFAANQILYSRGDLPQSAGLAFDRPVNIFVGDSIACGYGTNGTSANYYNLAAGYEYISTVQLLGGGSTFYNICLSGETAATMYSNFAGQVASIMNRYTGPINVILEGGTNDIYNGSSAASIATTYTNYCTSVHNLNAQAKCIVPTILNTTRNSGAQTTAAATLSSTVLSDLLAGTNGFDSVIDLNSNPALYGTNTNATYVYQGDGIGTHWTTAGQLAESYTVANGIAYAMRQPFAYKMTVPYFAFTTAGLTQTLTLENLFPKQVVSHITVRVDTAFAASGLTSAHATIGNSLGSATTYTGTGNYVDLTSTTTAQAYYSPQAQVADKGVIQINLTNVGANVSTFTAGSVEIIVYLENQQ